MKCKKPLDQSFRIIVCRPLNNIAPRLNSFSANLTPKCINGWTNLPASRLTECVIARNDIILAGIEEVRRMWGNEAAEAARQHILSDLKLEG
jgi:hypothetical protein